MIRTARLALAALALPLPAAAQMPAATLQPTDPDSPVERLGRYLRVLSTSPRDLEALTGAGRAALDVGDPNAAIGFFARAEEVAPRDGRVKAGLGAALVQMEQAKQALKLFDQAVELGVPAASIAADRGLAYDLRGDNRRAQADYTLALRGGPSDEVVRRLALSQAMAGDRAAAMATLDPLLRRQDKAAWRASTFVLALTGDARGAVERVGLLVPATQAQQIAPFLTRLASLKPGEQAEAVHFGHLPSATPRPATALAAASRPAVAPVAVAPSAGQTLVPAGAPLGGAPVRSAALAPTVPVRVAPVAVPTATAPSRVAAVEPGFSGLAGPVLAPTRVAPAVPAPVAAVSAMPAPVATRVAGPALNGAPVASPPVRVALADLPASRVAESAPVPVVPRVEPAAATPYPARVALGEVPVSRPVASPAVPVRVRSEPVGESFERSAARAARAEPVVEKAVVERAPVRVASVARRAAKPVAESEAEPVVATRKGKAGTKLASLDTAKAKGSADDEPGDRKSAKGKAAKGKAVDEAAEAKGTKTADAKKVADRKKVDPKKAKAEADAKAATAKAKKEPERHWVQVATGANKGDLAKAWAKVKAEHGQTMAGKSAWTTPLRFTNRVLVGPFKSAEEAQGFVNANAKAGFTTSRFTSPPGQAIERVGGK